MPQLHTEPHDGSSSRLNALRAAVLGANDGIVSVAGIVVGVAAATSSKSLLLTAGVAGIVAGALSMAVGEYVSVSSQRDSERALLEKERAELRDFPEEELVELQEIYEAKGLSRKTAQLVAKELTAHDVFAAHAEAELKIDPNDLNNPWHAAIASAISFLVGAIIPLIAIMVAPIGINVAVTFVAVLVALTLTGILSAHYGDANKVRATLRVVIGGAIAMAATYGIGSLVGIHGA
jgi:VIT1/CCC1 family predicted Fe2+/Mn2+ transporter